MMKILKSIGAALTAAFKFLGRVATAPLRMLGGLGGGGGSYDAPEMPEPADPAERDAEVASMEQQMATGLALANILQQHAINCIIEDRPMPAPPELDELGPWVRVLSRTECYAIAGAADTAVAAHIRGLFPLQGLRRVQPLPVARWAPEVEPETGPAQDLSGLAYAP